MKQLLDAYRREKRKQTEPSGSGASTKKPWQYYQAMRFVDDPALVRDMTGNMSTEGDEEHAPEEGVLDDEEHEVQTGLFASGNISTNFYLDQASRQQGDAQDDIEEVSQAHSSGNKRKRGPEKWTMVERLMGTMEENKRKTLLELQRTGMDPDRQFLLSLLPYIKKVLLLKFS